MKIPGSTVLHFTDNEQDVQKGKSPEVEVKVVVLKTTDIDQQLVKLLDGEGGEEEEEEEEKETEEEEEEIKKLKKPTQKAYRLQKKQIAMLESVVKIDEEQLHGENKIRTLLDQAKTRLEKIKRDGLAAVSRKDTEHRMYAVRRG